MGPDRTPKAEVLLCAREIFWFGWFYKVPNVEVWECQEALMVSSPYLALALAGTADGVLGHPWTWAEP